MRPILFLLAVGITCVFGNYFFWNDLDWEGVWVPWNGSWKGIPKNAVVGGGDEDGPLYVIRAKHYHNNEYRGLVTGKFSPRQWYAYIPYYNKEHAKKNFEVLTHTNYVWDYNYKNLNELISGGQTGSGVTHHICRAFISGYWIPGKLGNGRCFVGVDGKEREYLWNYLAIFSWQALKNPSF